MPDLHPCAGSVTVALAVSGSIGVLDMEGSYNIQRKMMTPRLEPKFRDIPEARAHISFAYLCHTSSKDLPRIAEARVHKLLRLVELSIISCAGKNGSDGRRSSAGGRVKTCRERSTTCACNGEDRRAWKISRFGRTR